MLVDGVGSGVVLVKELSENVNLDRVEVETFDDYPQSIFGCDDFTFVIQ